MIDAEWERFAEREPYFAILNAERFRRTQLTPLAEREFFASGESLVAWMMQVIDASLSPQFAPVSMLDFGCGVGRLTIPLAGLPGAITAVDRSPAMIRHAQRELERRGITHVRVQSDAELFGGTQKFDLVVCYQVLQRLPRRHGVALVRRLIAHLGPRGVGVFHVPVASRKPLWVRALREVRTESRALNTLVRRVRPSDAPFVPTTIYDLDTIRGIFDLGEFRTHVALERDDDLDVAVIFVERRDPVGPSAAVAVASPQAEDADDRPPASDAPTVIVPSYVIEAFNEAAETYYAALTNWDHHLAKPFSNVHETPTLLASVAVALEALRLQPGLSVLDFGAGTGWLSRCLTQSGCKTIVLDVSATAIDIARELYERVPVVGQCPEPSFIVFDGQRIPLPDASVDRIVCFDAFHHAPNPDAMIHEFARVLVPGGLAVFSEPGPRHAEAPRSRFEVGHYGVVEKDVDVHAIWRTAESAGFSAIEMCVFNGAPYHVPLERYEDLVAGGGEGAAWLASTRQFLRYVRNFVLVKGERAALDSRRTEGLVCDLRVIATRDRVALGEPVPIDAVVTNTGTAAWLGSDAGRGAVALGAHLRDEAGALLVFDFHWQALTTPSRTILPGEVIRVRFDLPPLAPGRYIVEFDCVAADVTWFAQVGSRSASIEAVVGDGA